MEIKKFTVCFRDTRDNTIHCEQGEGRVWPEAAVNVAERHINRGRKTPLDMSSQADRTIMAELRMAIEITHVFNGHHKQLG